VWGSGNDYREQALRNRAHFESVRADEAALKEKYRNAIFNWNEIEARAKKHAVYFSPSCEGHHRAAILDFLDNPQMPTRLNSMHMTWFYGANTKGELAHSCTHAVDRKKYEWLARHWNAYPLSGNPKDDRSVHWLREEFSLHRVGWTSDQWRQHEAEKRTMSDLRRLLSRPASSSKGKGARDPDFN
jgi:hypothetical protein